MSTPVSRYLYGRPAAGGYLGCLGYLRYCTSPPSDSLPVHPPTSTQQPTRTTPPSHCISISTTASAQLHPPAHVPLLYRAPGDPVTAFVKPSASSPRFPRLSLTMYSFDAILVQEPTDKRTRRLAATWRGIYFHIPQSLSPFLCVFGTSDNERPARPLTCQDTNEVSSVMSSSNNKTRQDKTG